MQWWFAVSTNILTAASNIRGYIYCGSLALSWHCDGTNWKNMAQLNLPCEDCYYKPTET